MEDKGPIITESATTRGAQRSDTAPSLGTLFSDLSDTFTLMFKEEVALARSEFSQTVSNAVRSAVSVVIGGVIAYTGVLALLAALVLLMIRAFDMVPWVATLIVGGIITVVGIIALMAGVKGLQSLDPMPRRTVSNVQEDVQVIKEKAQ